MDFTVSDALAYLRTDQADLHDRLCADLIERLNAAQPPLPEPIQDAIDEIFNWAEAYPLKAFPEPDMKAVRLALEGARIGLGCVSASNMRYVITRVRDRLKAAGAYSTATKSGDAQ